MTNLAATFLLALARRTKPTGVIINEHTLTRSQTCFHVRLLSRWFEFIRLDELARCLADQQLLLVEKGIDVEIVHATE